MVVMLNNEVDKTIYFSAVRQHLFVAAAVRVFLGECLIRFAPALLEWTRDWMRMKK